MLQWPVHKYSARFASAPLQRSAIGLQHSALRSQGQLYAAGRQIAVGMQGDAAAGARYYNNDNNNNDINDTNNNTVPIITCNPWNPVAI